MNILIIGAGGHGRVVLDILLAAKEHTPVAFIDADVSRANSTFAHLPILGPVNLLPKLARQDIQGAIVAIGDNRIRDSYASLVRQANLQLINAIHPSAILSPSVNLGQGIVIAPGAIVNAESSIADSAIINSGAVVEHECRIGTAVHICPGALLAGRVEAASHAFVGLGAKVIPCLKIGAGATVGAGAVVIRDVPPQSTVAGVPAHPLHPPSK